MQFKIRGNVEYIFKCLITAEHVIVVKKSNENKEIPNEVDEKAERMIDKVPTSKIFDEVNQKLPDIIIPDKIQIDFDDESREIKLDEKNRFIKGFNLGFNLENLKKPKEIDILLIQILPTDNIGDKYFLTDYLKEEQKEEINNKRIHIIQFPLNSRVLKESKGPIVDNNDIIFNHKASTFQGSSGSPIFLDNENTDKSVIIGVHSGGFEDSKINLGYFLYPVIFDLEKDPYLKERIKKSLDEPFSKTEINFKYIGTGYGQNSHKIFGKTFIKNNKDKIELYIDDKLYKGISDDINYSFK